MFGNRFRSYPSVATQGAVLALCGLAGWLAWRSRTSEPAAPSVARLSAIEAAPVAGPCEVLRVIDGDTLDIAQAAPPPHGPRRTFRIRLLGLNTPETKKHGVAVQPWGSEAVAFVEQFVKQGPVWLELDRRRIDRYGRFLAYISVGEQQLNEELLRAGLARRHDYPGDSYSQSRALARAADEARREGRGIWSGQPAAAGR